MQIKRIAVLGAGTMGHGIAYAAINGGYETRMFDVSEAALAKGQSAVEGIISKLQRSGEGARWTNSEAVTRG